MTIPLRYYHNNITSTLMLCEAMRAHGVRNLVFSSSATVYGNPAAVPITEDMPLSATNPYGRSKLMIEEILRDLYVSDTAWNIALLRYFNPVGAHASGRIGEDPNGIPNNLLPFVAQVAVGKLPGLQVFGNDYPTPDGTGIRDYIHVVDLALGHLAALDKLAADPGMVTYNLGTGRGYSVLEVIAAFEQVSGRKIPYKFVGRRAGDIAACYADPAKARAELGWEATPRPHRDVRRRVALAVGQPPGLRSLPMICHCEGCRPRNPAHKSGIASGLRTLAMTFSALILLPSHHPPQQRDVHLLRREPAVVAEVFLLEAILLIPPNRLPAIRQHDQVPHTAQERLRHRRRAEEAHGDQVGSSLDNRPSCQPARQVILRLTQHLVPHV